MMAPMIISVRAVLSEVFGARFICFAVFTTDFSTLLCEETFAFGLVDVRMPPREELTFFGLSESLEMSAMRPMGHRPKANSAAIKIQPPTSTSFFFFVFPPPSSKRIVFKILAHLPVLLFLARSRGALALKVDDLRLFTCLFVQHIERIELGF